MTRGTMADWKYRADSANLVNRNLTLSMEELRAERDRLAKELWTLKEMLHIPQYRYGRDMVMNMTLSGSVGIFHVTERIDESMVKMASSPRNVLMRHLYNRGEDMFAEYLNQARSGVNRA